MTHQSLSLIQFPALILLSKCTGFFVFAIIWLRHPSHQGSYGVFVYICIYIFFFCFIRQMQWRLMGKREREMWQRAAGQIRTWPGHSQPHAIWLPAHPTEINQHPVIWCFVVLCQEQLILETILSFLVAFQLLHFFQPTVQVPIPSTRFPELESGVSTDWGGCCSKLGEHDTTECGWKWDIVTE